MANRYPLDKPATKAKVVSYMLDGMSDGEIAAALAEKRITVTRQAVHAFRKRHADELMPAVAEVERQITDAAIADKVRRILDADADYHRLGSVIEARAADMRYDEPGYRSGVMVHQLKQIGSGRNAETVDEYKVDIALIAERRALRRAVAEELAQLPRPEINVTNDNRQIIVRYVEGPA